MGVELLGRGGLVTFNMEHFLQPSFGLGAGVLAAGNSDGGVLILPLYASFVPGNIHSAYFGGGVTIFGGTAFESDDTPVALTLSAGDQYHAPGGLFVRPLFTLFAGLGDTDGAFIWPGLTFGGSF